MSLDRGQHAKVDIRHRLLQPFGQFTLLREREQEIRLHADEGRALGWHAREAVPVGRRRQNNASRAPTWTGFGLEGPLECNDVGGEEIALYDARSGL